MNNTYELHVPFAELPVEARALLFLFAFSVNARFDVRPPTPGELTPVLERIWNDSELCLVDLSDPNRLTQLFKRGFTSATFQR